MALSIHPRASVGLPPQMADRVDALRAALERIVELTGTSTTGSESLMTEIWEDANRALDADEKAAAAQDAANEQHHAAEAETVYGWQPSGFIRELGDRPTDPMEPR